jgi:hypothetical protein
MRGRGGRRRQIRGSSRRGAPFSFWGDALGTGRLPGSGCWVAGVLVCGGLSLLMAWGVELKEETTVLVVAACTPVLNYISRRLGFSTRNVQ